MRVRLFWTIAIVAPFVAIVWADYNYNLGAPCLWLFFLAIAAALVATLELHPLLRPSDVCPSREAGLCAVLLVICPAAIPIFWPLLFGQPYPADHPLGRLGWTLLGMALVLILTLSLEMSRYKSPTGHAVVKAALVVFMAAYLGGSISFLLWLRSFRDNQWGMVALVSTIAIVKLSDMGAYVSGRLFGRRPLAPLLSPKKTIEGAIGGIIAAVLVAVGCRSLLIPLLVTHPATRIGGVLGWMLLGLLLGNAGILGDLAESLIKRDAGQKDSGSWLPGLGGMLDMLDSLLFAAPVAYAAWVAGLVGPG